MSLSPSLWPPLWSPYHDTKIFLSLFLPFISKLIWGETIQGRKLFKGGN